MTDGIIPGLLWTTCGLCHNRMAGSHSTRLGENDDQRVSLRFLRVTGNHDTHNSMVG
jgi:hypothetical protein